MNNTICFVNGNHRTTVQKDGTIIKETGRYEVVDGEKKWVETNSDVFIYEKPENITLKITDFCEGGCLFCSSNSTKDGKHGNLDCMSKIFESFYAGMKLNITGGDPFSHPHLEQFLTKMHDIGVIVNININQKDIKRHYEKIKCMMADGRIFGVGITLNDAHDKDSLKLIDKLGENTVIHAIAGILNQHDLPALQGRRILIQGFQKTGRGARLFEKYEKEIEKNMQWLQKKFPALQSMCKHISLDPLGVSQVKPARVLHLSELPPDMLDQTITKCNENGDITTSELYIDLPAMKAANFIDEDRSSLRDITGDENITELLKLTAKD